MLRFPGSSCKSYCRLRFMRRYSTVTVDTSETVHFRQYSDRWWDENGILKPLHSLNKLRIPLIRNGIMSSMDLQTRSSNPLPLQGFSILDVGCGGGILTEPLARLGGNVTGLDPNPDLIANAKSHAKLQNVGSLKYECSPIEKFYEYNMAKYDAVIISEVIEHVTWKREFLKSCIECLKPGGSIFITTIDNNWLSSFSTITLGENIMQLIPKGTHHRDKLISVKELQQLLEEQNCKMTLVHGTLYNPITNKWVWSSRVINTYCMQAVKLCST